MPAEGADIRRLVESKPRSFGIKLCCAEGLPPCPEDHVRQDPYAVLDIGGRVFKTRPDRLEPQFPVWNKAFCVQDIPPDEKYALIVIFDDNLVMEDTVIARATIDLDELAEGPGVCEVNLTTKDNQPAGKLKMEVQPVNFGTAEEERVDVGEKLAELGYSGLSGGPPNFASATLGRARTFAVQGTMGGGFEEISGLMGGGAVRGGGAVCKRDRFTVVEDRPVIKERRQYFMEHHPVEREMVVETRTTGRERAVMGGRRGELIGREERVVQEAQRQRCPPAVF